MNTSYKVIGRYTGREASYYHINERQIGRQAKKRVYVSEKDFNKYAPELIERWKDMGWDIEVYMMDDNTNWVKIQYA